MTDSPQAAAGGLATTLRAALGAGALAGLLTGSIDALAAFAEVPPHGAVAVAGCLATSALVYGLAYCAALLPLGALAHPLLKGRTFERRRALALGLALGAWSFLSIYWRTRPWVFYGRSATSPERLAAAAGMLVLGLAFGALAAWLLTRASARARRALIGLAFACWFGGGAWLALDRVEQRGAIHSRNQDQPNVLLIVVDALRADVLGCYGNTRVKTPAIDAIARRGVVFERAVAQAPFTWPSFGSILTGKYPRRHGLTKMHWSVAMMPNVTLPVHLKSGARRDGRAMQGDDWATATFMTGTLSHGSGLSQGFDTYFEGNVGHERVDLDSTWSPFRSRLLLFLVKNKLTQRIDSSLVVTEARRWLREQRGRRFALMVHLYSTHTPYDPPARFRADYCDPAYRGPIPAFYAEHRKAIETGQYAPTEADLAQIRNLYEAGTAHADAMIGELVDELRAIGALDDTLVIVTADHGESLGEKDWAGHVLWEHDHMVQTNLRVPLVMSWPGGLAQGVRVGAVVESVDIVPTVSELLGLELPRDERSGERGKVDGASLLPWIRGEAGAGAALGFSENAFWLSVQDERWKLLVRPAAFAPDRTEEGPTVGGEPPVLFDLAVDPHETRNAQADEPAVVERLYAALQAWNASLPIGAHLIELSHRDLEQERIFNGLGYTGGVDGTALDDEACPCGSGLEREKCHGEGI